MNKQPKTYKSLDELPLALSASDVQSVLGISRASAYNLLNRPDFPKLHIGTRVVVPKERFISWFIGSIEGGEKNV